MITFIRSSITILFVIALLFAGNAVAEHKAESIIGDHNHTSLCKECAKEKDSKVFFVTSIPAISFAPSIYDAQLRQSPYFNTSIYTAIRAPPTC